MKPNKSILKSSKKFGLLITFTAVLLAQQIKLNPAEAFYSQPEVRESELARKEHQSNRAEILAEITPLTPESNKTEKSEATGNNEKAESENGSGTQTTEGKVQSESSAQSESTGQKQPEVQKQPPLTPGAPSAAEIVPAPSKPEKAEAAPKSKKRELPDCLPCLTWVDPDVETKAILLCIHGLGLHNDSYEDFGKRVSKLGYLVMAVDMPGFGSFQQAGEGRDRVDFDYCLRGLRDTLKLIHKVNPGLPVFVLGESMGGAIALRITSEHPELVDGLISSVPSGDRFKQGKETLRIGLKLLTAPNKEFDIGTSVIERATQSDELKEKWTKDPFNRMNLTPRELVKFQSFMNDNHESAKKITATPVLFVQGCKDKLVRPEGTVELFNAIGTVDREIELINDKEHLIFEEGQFNDQVIEMLDRWLGNHIKKLKEKAG